MEKRLYWTVDSDGMRWGQPFPIFHIYKSGKEYILKYIRNPKAKPRSIQVKSIQHGKIIADLIASGKRKS